MSEQDERILKQWADSYAEHYGASLLQEREALRQQNLRYATPRADRLAKDLAASQAAGQAKAKRKRTPLFATAAAAALLVLFIGSFAVISNLSDLVSSGSGSDLAPSQSAPTSPEESPDGAPSSQDPKPALQPLTFNLPVRFSVAETKYDRGQSIYTLADSRHDDVVLVLEEPRGQNDGRADMDSIIIDGTAVAAVVKDEYKLLQFEEDGTLYTISCRDDLGTLATLYRSITDKENKKV